MTPPFSRRIRWHLAFTAVGLGLTQALFATVIESTSVGPVVFAPYQTIELGSQILFIQPPPPDWNRVRIQSGTTVELKLSEIFTGATNITWWCNDTQLAATGSASSYLIEDFSSAHNGNYQARFTLNGSSANSGDAELIAAPLGTGPLLNLSTRATLSAGSTAITSGFVIDGAGLPAGGSRYVLIRAVGPSLADFGVPNPLPDPRLVVHDVSTGHDILIGFPAVIYPDGTTPQSRYYDWIRRVSAAVGAFPIDLYTPENPAAPEDAMLVALRPGAYTATLRSATGVSGEVMVEVYEVSDKIAHELLSEPPPLGEVPAVPGS